MPTPSMLDEKLRELALFEPTTMPVLSVYLNTQADQHGRDSFEPFLFVIAGSIVVGSTLFLLMPKARDYPKIG